MEVRKLLVCVDGSRASLEAARVGIELAAGWHSEVRAVYVVETSDADGLPDPALIARLRESGRAILERIVEIGAEKGVKVVQETLEGEPFDAILGVAKTWHADMIVMGRTGRTGPGRALLGSAAERVLEFTEQPVLIVPTLEPATR
ncbi:MAG TPA: universal stress protein [Candidatus Dormibacteraeota bacterium]|nr:universal stress protein [Candidatus Dormibacteraeota bacterium]